MLARCSVVSTMSGVHGAQVVRRQANRVHEKGAEAIAAEKRFALLSSFFLCISMQWLFCECPEVGVPEKALEYVQCTDGRGCSNARTA
jgi:hypothetical protein